MVGWQLGAVGVCVTIGATLLALVGLPRPARAAELESDEALRSHLARARRRGEPADVLVVRLTESSPAAARRLKETLRVTDSSYLLWDGATFELRAMVDRQRLDRAALEARLRSVVASPVEIGWARFPEDGCTLAVLLAEARRECQPAEQPEPSDRFTSAEQLGAHGGQRSVAGQWAPEVASR